MSRNRKTTFWPIMLTLSFLFGMSLTAPRSWESFAQRRPLEPTAGSREVATTRSKPDLNAGRVHMWVARSVPAETMAAPSQPRVSSNFTTSVPSTVPTETAVSTTPAVAAPKMTLSGFGPAKPAAPSLSGAPAPAAMPNLSGGPKLSAGPVAQPIITPAATPTLSKPKPAVAAPPSLAPSLPTLPVLTTALPNPQPVVPSSVPANVRAVQPMPKVETVRAPETTIASLPMPASNPASISPTVQPAVVAPSMVVPAPTNSHPRLNGPSPATTVKPSTSATSPEFVARRGDDPSIKTKVPQLGPSTTPKIVEPTVVAATPESWWPKPADLISRLEKLRNKDATRTWAERAEGTLERLSAASRPGAERLQSTLVELRTLLADARHLDDSRLDTATAIEMRLTRHAIERRLDIWESLAHVIAAKRPQQTADTRQLEVCLVDIERKTAEAGDTGRQWHNYLLVDSLEGVARGEADSSQTRAVAREVLARLRRASATSEKNQFLREGPFAELDEQLRLFASEEIDGRELLASIEKFEVGGLPSDAKSLADQCRLLEYSTDEERRQLAVWLTSHYRNANLRVTLSSEILNRMLPEELRKNAPVRDTILGNVTQGWSTTRTGMNIRFLPSDDTLAVRFEAQGHVTAQTQTFSGPVRLFSHSDSTFIAHKDLSLTMHGFEVAPAVARTNSRSRLRGIRTEFDHVPILGSIVESIALDQHAEKRGAAQREAASKISGQVQRGFDAEIDKHLTDADGKLNQRILDPLLQSRLAPEVVELQSNEHRAIVRLRVAGDDQLAAYTPRPRAYSDNVASLQIHQSALNNVLERCELQQRRFTAHELYHHIINRFQLPDTLDPSIMPDDIEITFANVDPMTLRFDAGTVELRVAIDELKVGTRVWRDFVVRTQFKPRVIDGETYLTRDGIVRLNGPKLGTTSQISLRAVFAKIFPDDMKFGLWPAELKADARFSDLTIAQVDLRDGWLGVAVGPQRHYPQAALPLPRRR